MKEWTIRYCHTPPIERDTFTCVAETEEEALEEFEAATNDLDEVEIDNGYPTSKDYVDPNQLKFAEMEVSP